MKILHPEEHLSCYNYERPERSSIELMRMPRGEEIAKQLTETEIVFILKGEVSISYGTHLDQKIGQGEIILLPQSYHIKARVESDAFVTVMHIRSAIQLCERCTLNRLYEKGRRYDPHIHTLKINDVLQKYLDNLFFFTEAGLRCSYYSELKIKEFLFILRYFYPKEQLAGFFQPLLSANMGFSDFVFKHYRQVQTVQQFASLSNYSQSGFEKQFKKVFGIAPYKWMKQKKAVHLYHELNCSGKSLKQICTEFNFSSLSQLSDFCKSNFGMPPGKIRNRPGREMSAETADNPEENSLQKYGIRIDS